MWWQVEHNGDTDRVVLAMQVMNPEYLRWRDAGGPVEGVAGGPVGGEVKKKTRRTRREKPASEL